MLTRMLMTIRARQISKAPSAVRARALAAGYRSGLEEHNAAHLRAHGVQVQFEPYAFKYPPPSQTKRYTPDFPLPNGIVAETKGRFLGSDRTKHLSIKKTHPNLDIRFVFQNPRAKLSASSKITYAAWAEKNGFLWAEKLIPVAWIEEPSCPAKLAAIQSAINWSPPKQ